MQIAEILKRSTVRDRAYKTAEQIQPLGGCDAIVGEQVDPRTLAFIQIRLKQKRPINLPLLCSGCLFSTGCSKKIS